MSNRQRYQLMRELSLPRTARSLRLLDGITSQPEVTGGISSIPGPPGEDGKNAEAVLSTAPVDGYQVKNLYVDTSVSPAVLAFDYDDTLLGVNQNPGLIGSIPPAGNYVKVENMYVTAAGTLAFEYDDGT